MDGEGHRLRRWRLRRSVTCAQAAVAALCLASAAHAGTFQVRACSGSSSGANNAWVPFGNDANYLEIKAGCGGDTGKVTGGPRADTSGLSVSDVLGLAAGVPQLATAGWTFTAPSGATIESATLDRDLYKRNDNRWLLFVSDPSGLVPGQDCAIVPGEYQCEVAGDLNLTGLSVASLSIGVSCATGCLNGFSDHNVRADLDSAVVTLWAASPPARPTATGPLTQPTWHSGVAGLDVSSTDPVGISQVQLKGADGTVLATATLPCDYTYPVPCRQAIGVPLSIDTTELPDGVDTMTLVATDAAQNTATSPITVMIANHAPPPPRLTGAPAGRSHKPSATITAKLAAGGVPISAVHWRLCGSVGCGAETAVAVPPGTATATFTVTVPADGNYTVAAYATDVAGHRSAPATEPFAVDRTLPATDGSGSPAAGTRGPASGAPPMLPAGSNASLRLPALVGRPGLRLRLTLRRRRHQRVELDLRTSPARPGRVRVGMTFSGHRARIRRLTLHRGVGSLTTPVPAGPTTLTLTLVGLGVRGTDRIRLAAPGPRP